MTDLESKTNSLLKLVNEDYIKLTSIQQSLDASRTAAGAIVISYQIFFTPFKTEITLLDNLCQEYLNRYSSLVTGKRQLN